MRRWWQSSAGLVIRLAPNAAGYFISRPHTFFLSPRLDRWWGPSSALWV
jgi:hypothetical protein